MNNGVNGIQALKGIVAFCGCSSKQALEGRLAKPLDKVHP
jgi:hypothetical protein